MPLKVEPTEGAAALDSCSVFLSASIPDPERWDRGSFDALEITDAVVAAARAVLYAGGVLVTAAHPTIAPLLLYVAAEFPRQEGEARIIVYQSEVFADVLPEPTARFRDEGIGDFRWTSAAPGETADPGNRGESLRSMRHQMLMETQPVAAIFIGGMQGIADEYELIRELVPSASLYPIGRPGGEARVLAEESDSVLAQLLLEGDVYPALFRRIVREILARSR